MAEQRIIKALRARALADKEKALMQLDLILNNPVAVGDHTSKDFFEDAMDSLRQLSDAESSLDMIEFYLSENGPNSKQLLKG